MKMCDWCFNEFQPNVNYQIYCSVECRKLSTKEKAIEKYQSKRRKKISKKERRCGGDCGTILSIYNSAAFCQNCMVNWRKVDKALKELKGIIEYERFEK